MTNATQAFSTLWFYKSGSDIALPSLLPTNKKKKAHRLRMSCFIHWITNNDLFIWTLYQESGKIRLKPKISYCLGTYGRLNRQRIPSQSSSDYISLGNRQLISVKFFSLFAFSVKHNALFGRCRYRSDQLNVQRDQRTSDSVFVFPETF